MKNKNNRLKLFKFLATIYNPTKYPLKYNLINKIANGMFSKIYSKKLLKNFSGSDLGYSIDIKNDLFELNKFVSRATYAIKYVMKKHDFLWGLFPLFNKQEVELEFWDKFNNNMTFDNKKILLQISMQEINKLKKIETIISREREVARLKYYLARENFEMIRRLYDYPPYYLLKASIRNYLNFWYKNNKKSGLIQ